MKTADLIPFILLELNECDKYGFELTKAIETKSNGKIVIKQPTLYTLLKKLEKSKFIASYWEDSEIGGKRHYYKLTENGRLQVATLPSYDFLLKNALDEEITEDEVSPVNVDQKTQANVVPEKKISIMDELLGSNSTPTETILPSEEVFSENNIDNSTEFDINASNTEILKNENISIDEQFATNEDVKKFTEKIVTTPEITKNKNNFETVPVSNNILDVDFTIPKNETEVKYVNYVDLKNNDNFKYSKKLTKRMLFQTLTTSVSLIIMLIICGFVTSFTSRSGLFYFFFIGGILVSLFYPIIYGVNMEKFRLKYQTTNYTTKTKLKLYIGLTLLLTVVVICVILNISMGKNTIGLILEIKNFANFYAPILITSIYFFDLLYNHLFLSKLNK